MTMEQAPATPLKLAFGATFSAAFKTVFGSLGLFVKAAALPLVFSLGLSGIAVFVAVADAESVSAMRYVTLLHVVGLLPIAFFSVAYSRRLVPDDRIKRDAADFSLRTAAKGYVYILLFLLVIVLLAAVVVFSLTIGPMLFMTGASAQIFLNLIVALPLRLLMPWTLFIEAKFQLGGTDMLFEMGAFAIVGPFLVPFGSFMPWFVLFSLPVLWGLTRLSLVLPAVSLGRKLGLAGSWRLTRGSGLKLFAVLLAITALSLAARVLFLSTFGKSLYLLLTGLGIDIVHGGPINWTLIAATHVGEFLLLYLGAALLAAALAGAYARLAGGQRSAVLETLKTSD